MTRGDWGQSAYNATKAAITNFVRSLALDWGSRGVRLNAVAPSFTITELTEGVGDDERVLAAFTNRIALGRPARPDDIAPAVLFLASAGARYITGAVLPRRRWHQRLHRPAASLGPATSPTSTPRAERILPRDAITAPSRSRSTHDWSILARHAGVSSPQRSSRGPPGAPR